MLTEYCSALTMCAPAMLITYYHYTQPVNVCTKCIWLGTILHAPFSIMYHVLCANSFFRDPIENIPRKLDQVMIHVGAICFLVGVSTYDMYNQIAIVFNQLSVSYIFWSFSRKEIRRMNILLSIIFYVLPIGLRILIYMSLGIYGFVRNPQWYGYGTSLFHVCLCGLVHHMHEYCALQEN